jgi:hypothetical protein
MHWMDGYLGGGSMVPFALCVLIGRVKARFYDVEKFEDGDFRL